MNTRRIVWLLLIAALAAVTLSWAVRPKTLPADALAGLTGEAMRGEVIFHAGGCASCHMSPDETSTTLSGGRRFQTRFGVFIAPNISSDPEYGIGSWTVWDLANAMHHGTSPDGRHYYPAFPYAAYARMTLADIVDLKTYLDTLPADSTPSQPHALTFPFNIRAAVGLWKMLHLSTDWVMTEMPTPELARGRYLAEALAHCGECHTPRNILAGLNKARWLAGGPNPSGEGRIPNITPAGLDWSKEDLVIYFTSGLTPDYDSAGGEMTEVIRNLSRLPSEDRAALAAYVKALPAVR